MGDNLTFEQQKEIVELKHKYAMEEVEAEKKSHMLVEKFRHDNEMEMHRIKNADIKRSIMARQDGRSYK